MISQSSRRITTRTVFFLGALIALLSLLPAILPYGGRFVTRGDYIEQQLPFLLEAQRILRGGLNSYSFSTFLGAPAVGSYAFYTLGSPFVWPLAFLPQVLLPFGISVMAVLKHAIACLTAFLYLRRMLRREDLAMLGGVLYAFSSFTIVNTQFYHFTEVIAFFPLILLGIEHAMTDEHPSLVRLALACGLNTLTNYYFMLSSALLTALYTTFRLFSEDWKPTRSLRRLFMTVMACGVGCGLAGVLLLPSLMHMLSITRTGASDTPVWMQVFSPSTFMERIRVLLMPIESNVVHAYYGDAPSWCSTAAYLPVFGLTGVTVWILFGHTQHWLKALVLTLIAVSFVPMINGIFALMTNPTYTRWWYGLVLLLVLTTLYALRDVSNRRAWCIAFVLCSVLCLILTVPFLLPEIALDHFPERLAQILRNRRMNAYASDVFRTLSVWLGLLGAGGMGLLLLTRPCFSKLLALVSCIAIVQYGAYIAVGDQHILSGGTEPGNGIYTLREIAEPTLNALEQTQDFARIDTGRRIRNYGLIRGQSSLTCFNSLRTSTIGRFIRTAEFGYDESTTVMPPNASAPLRALLSVTEYHRFDETDVVPEGFVYDREENGFAVYTNPNAVPMGFLQTTITGTHHQRMDADTLGTVLLAATALDDDALAKLDGRLPRLDVYAIPDWETSVSLLRTRACDHFQTRADGFSAHIQTDEAGLLVFTIPFDKGFSATVDGQPSEIIPCDLSFMSVWLEPGDHEIVFTYHTRMLNLGIVMSLMSATVLISFVLLRKLYWKRHS